MLLVCFIIYFIKYLFIYFLQNFIFYTEIQA